MIVIIITVLNIAGLIFGLNPDKILSRRQRIKGCLRQADVLFPVYHIGEVQIPCQDKLIGNIFSVQIISRIPQYGHMSIFFVRCTHIKGQRFFQALQVITVILLHLAGQG